MEDWQGTDPNAVQGDTGGWDYNQDGSYNIDENGAPLPADTTAEQQQWASSYPSYYGEGGAYAGEQAPGEYGSIWPVDPNSVDYSGMEPYEPYASEAPEVTTPEDRKSVV